jgi:hypothetical protein
MGSGAMGEGEDGCVLGSAVCTERRGGEAFGDGASPFLALWWSRLENG